MEPCGQTRRAVDSSSAAREPGIDLPGIFPVRTVPDAREIREWIARGTPSLSGMDQYSGLQTVRPKMRAVLVGGGFIGLATAGNLVHRGFDVTRAAFLRSEAARPRWAVGPARHRRPGRAEPSDHRCTRRLRQGVSRLPSTITLLSRRRLVGVAARLPRRAHAPTPYAEKGRRGAVAGGCAVATV